MKFSNLLNDQTRNSLSRYLSHVLSNGELSYKHEAKTIIAAFVVGQTATIAAQRLLSWDCVDNCRVEEDLCAVTPERAKPFIEMAFHGYLFLNENYANAQT